MYQPKRSQYQSISSGGSVDGLSYVSGQTGTPARLAYREQYIRSMHQTSALSGGGQSTRQPVRTSVALQAQATPVHTPAEAPVRSAGTQTAIKSEERSDNVFENMEFTLPEYEAAERPKIPVRRRGGVRKTILRGVSVVVATVMLSGGVLAWQGYTKMNQVFHGQATVAALSERPVAPELLRGEGDGRINILLLGVGGAGHDGGDLTDTMMVLSVDPVNHTAAAISLPRDLWIKSPVTKGTEYQKINAVFTTAKSAYLAKNSQATRKQLTEVGFQAVDQAVGTVLGVKVDYHVLADFKAFSQAIDTVEGITVDVKETLDDPMLAWENNNSTRVANVGMQTMNGKQALLYARSRYTTSDFARNERQRAIVVALKNKATTMRNISDPTRLTALMDAFSANMYSDLSPTGATRLLSIMRNVGNEKITSVSLVDKPSPLVAPVVVEGVSTVQPVAGPSNYADIQDYIRSKVHDGYLARETASVYIVAKTTEAGKQAMQHLRSYGYNVTSYVQGQVKLEDSVVYDLSGGSAPYTKHYLEGRYSVLGPEKIPSDISVPVGTKFVIILAK